MKKVVVAMSGGVDSSVAAALLKKQGFNVVGVFMKFWLAPRSPEGEVGKGFNRCCSPDSERRARMVAKILKIPFYVFNFEKEFKKRVVDYFIKGYKDGITPNPCVVCNKEIKFGLLLEKALALGADFIATGHYARIVSVKPGLTEKIMRGKDRNKDQTYFLWQLNQKQLKRILFPVGGYTKPEVRKLAEKFKLPFKKVGESMEICFVPDKLDDFLKKHLKLRPGPIIAYPEQAKLLAPGKQWPKHRGLPFYTIGQRKGMELSGGPYYVVGKDKKKNTLIVASILKDSALWSKSLIAKNVNWISGKEPKFPLKINAQIRYRHPAVPAVITKKLQATNYKLTFKSPQRAVTSGQSVVLYKKRELVGGGIIC